MQNQRKQVITLAIVSLMLFLAVNGLMILKAMQLSTPVVMSVFWRTNAVAAILYIVAIVLATLKLKVSYYLLAVVIANYTVGLVSVIITLFTASQANILLKLVAFVVAILGIVINVTWYMQAFKLRNLYVQNLIKQRASQTK